MTLDEVMKLEGRELDAACAEAMGIKVLRHDPTILLYIPRNKPARTHLSAAEVVPHFSTDWNAAMQVREWARELDAHDQRLFAVWLLRCCEWRVGHPRETMLIIDLEPIDYARAAVLVTQFAKLIAKPIDYKT